MILKSSRQAVKHLGPSNAKKIKITIDAGYIERQNVWQWQRRQILNITKVTMNYKTVLTRKTIKRGLSKIDYTHELEFNGKDITLRTRWFKDGKSGGGSFSILDDDYTPELIAKVFHGLNLECFQDDGTPTFNNGEERFHLVHAEQVTLGTDLLEI